MVRQRPADFVPRMLEAAGHVFARRGLKGARMTDIAREMGVAHGSLYNYVESKEALFLLLVDQWGRDAIDVSGEELPLKTPSMHSIVDRLQQRVTETFPLANLTGSPQTWAFARWGGDFWVFLKRGSDQATKIYQFDGTDATLKKTIDTNLEGPTTRNIVGAAVSTCAPVILLKSANCASAGAAHTDTAAASAAARSLNPDVMSAPLSGDCPAAPVPSPNPRRL